LASLADRRSTMPNHPSLISKPPQANRLAGFVGAAMPRDRGQGTFEKRERVLRRQVEPAPLARGGEQAWIARRRSSLVVRGASSSTAAATLSSSAPPPPRRHRTDRPVPLALCVLAVLPAPLARVRDSATASARAASVASSISLEGRGLKLEVDPQQTELLLELADDEVRIDGQLRGQPIDDLEPAVRRMRSPPGRRAVKDGTGEASASR